MMMMMMMMNMQCQRQQNHVNTYIKLTNIIVCLHYVWYIIKQ